jgi:hypothetical protein
MNWGLIGRGLRLTYVLRVPLLTLLLLAAFGPISLASNLLGNLLDQAGDGLYLFAVSFAAFLLAFTAVTTLNLILHYGKLRFESKFAQGLGQKHPLLVFFSGCIRRGGGASAGLRRQGNSTRADRSGYHTTSPSFSGISGIPDLAAGTLFRQHLLLVLEKLKGD